MQSRGWEVHGTETSPAAIRLARLNGIEPVMAASVRDAGFPEDYFDAVTLWHVVEHLPDPAGELIELQRIVKPDGALIAEVPNIDSWMFAICRQDWFPLDIPRHLQHFTPKTLDRLLSKGGFTVVDRQNFHLTDPALVALSALQRTGMLKHGRAGEMVEDFRSMSVERKTLLALMAPLALLISAGLSPLLVALSRNSETITVAAVRAVES
jgi:2-polyprenyl-3-methyl-5-hydroxy-6-metoxy-1,4-benzoquinol methylase